MQNIHDYSMTGGCGGGGSTGRFFGGGRGGDRRMRAHQNHHQSLKCPRCNSFNTKFCYYNNYNLSQPRYFCKNCRRYWTKGGVLRNVPVGGGCRKAKRSKSKKEQLPSSSPSSADKPTSHDVEEKSSSSESSSLTAATTTTTAADVKDASSGFIGTDMHNLKLYGNGIEWSTLLGQGSSDGGVFSEIGHFTQNETTTFGFGGISVNHHLKFDGNTTVHQQLGDQTAQVDLNMGLEPLDWGSGRGDQTFFDLTSTVDHAYWSPSQWTKSSDHKDDLNGLYLP